MPPEQRPEPGHDRRVPVVIPRVQHLLILGDTVIFGIARREDEHAATEQDQGGDHNAQAMRISSGHGMPISYGVSSDAAKSRRFASGMRRAAPYPVKRTVDRAGWYAPSKTYPIVQTGLKRSTGDKREGVCRPIRHWSSSTCRW